MAGGGDADQRHATGAAPPASDPGQEGDGDLARSELAQSELARLRGRLLGGRGPGASDAETARYMHQRRSVGGVPTVIERDLVATRAGLARRDIAAVQAELGTARDDLAAALEALAEQLAPRHLAASAARAARMRCAALLGVPAVADRRAATNPMPDTAAGELDRDGQWRRFAARAAVASAAATLLLVLLAIAGRRRLRRSAARAGTRRGR